MKKQVNRIYVNTKGCIGLVIGTCSTIEEGKKICAEFVKNNKDGINAGWVDYPWFFTDGLK